MSFIRLELPTEGPGFGVNESASVVVYGVFEQKHA
jgi:hypothetical protein